MTERAFDYFVVLAGMRTGSNLLEEYLAAMPGLRSYGELFNPHFFGKPKKKEMFGLSMTARDGDPLRVIDAMKVDGAGLPGFRLFDDHDRRVADHVLADRRAAKIVLSRRPIDSYVSLKIARRTGQWWLGDMPSARTARVPFDVAEYAEFLNGVSDFQRRIQRALQTTGQTAFFIGYSDLTDPEIIEGLGRFLGAAGGPDASRVKAKVQNPTPVWDRLTNPDDAEEALKAFAAPDIEHRPSHEPERGPGLRLFHACGSVPLLYMPIRGAGSDSVPDWMARLDPDGEVETGMTQKDVRRWMRQHPGHRSFTVLRHPLPRAYDAFRNLGSADDEGTYADIRDALSARYGVPPDGWNGSDVGVKRTAFLEFLRFISGNLGGQTSLRVDHTWASQAAFLSAMARFVTPDRVVREESLTVELAQLGEAVGLPKVPEVPERADGVLAELAEIRTPEIDAACAEAYRRDYVFFGFRDWAAGQAA